MKMRMYNCNACRRVFVGPDYNEHPELADTVICPDCGHRLIEHCHMAQLTAPEPQENTPKNISDMSPQEFEQMLREVHRTFKQSSMSDFKGSCACAFCGNVFISNGKLHPYSCSERNGTIFCNMCGKVIYEKHHD